ncbi:MAG: cupin domain-containing protein [Nitrospirae bacterium]|jgi:1,2-dihydroxy-3-keto-5-methylthiopentene dioxygenase|uniref:Acireductone dioxygenase n=1 Tax=Leptospirillum ferrodiazotrophum TaxID=412449 RepID=C6HX30_9BACT|nr:MAG: Acireductone dioxygenase, ARD [Leptospirillum ferrodiazotrophum]MCL5953637.1 cupin domain-containing protein [Nitrospirota bacterium]
MAILFCTDKRQITTLPEIAKILTPIGVKLDAWPVPETQPLKDLLGKPRLTPSEQEEVLSSFLPRFDDLKKTLGYQTQDLIVLDPDLPGLSALEEKFRSCHTHDDDEIRYIVEGEGIFGFVLADGDQVELLVESGDYINVPRGAEHWFRLTPSRRIKAVRYFTSREGWVPLYTGRPLSSAFA